MREKLAKPSTMATILSPARDDAPSFRYLVGTIYLFQFQ